MSSFVSRGKYSPPEPRPIRWKVPEASRRCSGPCGRNLGWRLSLCPRYGGDGGSQMKARLWLGAAALALLAPIGDAAAQSAVTRETVTTRETVRLSPEQRTTIYRRVTQQPRAASRALPMKEVEVGVRVPDAAELYDLPEPVIADVPAVRRYRYMMIGNEVVLVDPQTSQVVEIIRE